MDIHAASMQVTVLMVVVPECYGKLVNLGTGGNLTAGRQLLARAEAVENAAVKRVKSIGEQLVPLTKQTASIVVTGVG